MIGSSITKSPMVNNYNYCLVRRLKIAHYMHMCMYMCMVPIHVHVHVHAWYLHVHVHVPAWYLYMYMHDILPNSTYLMSSENRKKHFDCRECW